MLKLIINLSDRLGKDAIKKLKWYAMRWKIQTFHKILKSGCKAEESKLRSNLIYIFCILSWRIFWMTMVNRLRQPVKATFALTPIEITLLNTHIKDKNK